jgi:hypothetical protein
LSRLDAASATSERLKVRTVMPNIRNQVRKVISTLVVLDIIIRPDRENGALPPDKRSYHRNAHIKVDQPGRLA